MELLVRFHNEKNGAFLMASPGWIMLDRMLPLTRIGAGRQLCE
jgi:hypothetical protein